MEGREGRDPGYDDWFDEPEPPTETDAGATRGIYDADEEVWVVPEEEPRRREHGRREVVVAGRTLTMTQVAIIVASVLAILLAVLAAFGVFSGSSKPAPPPVTTPPPTTVSHSTSTPTVTTPTAKAPSQTLAPGDTGAQVKVLQEALTALGFSPGKADGTYGPATEAAVKKFQTSKGLTADGVVGPQTLAALQRDLSG